MQNHKPLILGVDIEKTFPIRSRFFFERKRYVHAVNGVSLNIFKGETVGLVGETGCGKTTLGRLILRLIEPTSGDLFFDPPEEIAHSILEGKKLNEEELKRYSFFRFSPNRVRKTRREMQIVFQDPYFSLDPRYLIRDIIAEPLMAFNTGRKEAYERAEDLLEIMGLGSNFMNKFPHELSGGQRQRVAIARALVSNPKFIVFDEPTSALDVSVQAQVLNLLYDLKERFELTALFISHNIVVVRHVADRIIVMYLGEFVETAEIREMFSSPLHPYTQALLSSVPIPDPKTKKKRMVLQGEVPSTINLPTGCKFHPRCPLSMEICRAKKPPMFEIKSGHYVACWLYSPKL